MELYQSVVKSIEEIILTNHMIDDKLRVKYTCGAIQFSPQTNVKVHLGFESLDQFELGMYLEDKYGIHIRDGDMVSSRTFDDYAKLVLKNL